MKHTYQIQGATCQNCGEKVASTLKSIPGITKTETPEKGIIIVDMSKHIDINSMNQALQKAGHGKYTLEMIQNHSPSTNTQTQTKPKTWKDYKPLILVVSYILIGTTLGLHITQDWSLMMGMRIFMGLFFLVFSFFKMLDIQGFAMSYMSYDILAAKWMKWGYIYPFFELAFGIGYLAGWQLFYLNILVAIVMGISLIGVVKSVLNKKQIQCACLGTGFDLPMSTVTIVEDGLMVLMAIWMTLNLY